MAEDNVADMHTGDHESSGENAPNPKTPPVAFWVPETKNYVPGSALDLDQKLKQAGIKLRRELLTSANMT